MGCRFGIGWLAYESCTVSHFLVSKNCPALGGDVSPERYFMPKYKNTDSKIMMAPCVKLVSLAHPHIQS